MIRDVEKADYQTIVAIYNHYICNTVISFEEEEIDCGEISSRIDKVHSAGLSWLVVEQNHKVLGYAYASLWNERAAYRNTVEVSVYLHHQAVGKGYGRMLYEALFHRLRKTSVHVVISGIALPNPESVRLHEKFGMKKVAHYQEVGYKFGQWIDVGYWQLQLAG